MKKIFLLSSILMLAFSACQNVNDNFDWLDETTKPVNKGNYSLTISPANITTIVSATKGTANAEYGTQLQKDGMFSDAAPAETLIPYALTSLYFSADQGSSATVTYQFKNNRDAVVSGLSTSANDPAFVLSNDNYKAVWGDTYATALTPSKSPGVELPKLLKANFPDAVDGAYKVIEYFYSEKEPVSSIVVGKSIYSQNFEDLGLKANDPVAIDGWLNVDLEGTKSWQMKSFDNNFYAQASSNGSKGKNDNWLILKPIDLKNATNPYFTFDVKVGYYNSSCLKILVSTDFDGKEANIKTAKWTDITSQFTIPTTPTNGYGTNFENTGLGSLNAYKGKTAYIAFRYEGDDVSTLKATTTYQIDNVNVTEAILGKEVKDKETVYTAYQNVSGTWKPVSSDVVVLQPSDYEYATLSNGYISSTEAPQYLNAILLHNQLSLNGSEKVVVYKTSKTNFYADRLTYKNGVWSTNSLIEERTGQFVLSSIGWVFDPTFNIVMQKGNTTGSDFMLVVDYVKAGLALETPALINKYGDAEYYYGFTANYGNITYRESDRKNDPTYPIGGTDSEKLDYCEKRTIEGLNIFLGIKYPDATPLVNGIEQKAKVTTVIYYGPAQSNVATFEYEFQCVGQKEWKYINRTAK